MTATERRAAVGLAAIMAARMLGLFLILPIFTLYAPELQGSTPALIGVAIGAYGLSQAFLQIPMGVASDRWGRQPVIIFGLLLFVLGSAVAALSDHIYGVILGRLLQGAGAISAAVMALAADLTRESQRTKIMASLGISIGGSFMLAMVLGPLLAGWVGLGGVFWSMAALALTSIALLLLLVPKPERSFEPAPVGKLPSQIGRVLRDPGMLRLNFGIFALHAILTAGFVVLPVVLQETLGLERDRHWQFYVPILLLSVLGMVPVIMIGERRRQMPKVLALTVLVLALVELALAASLSRPLPLLVALWLYFTAFNVLEASLPSLVSKVAPPQVKGAALGVYSTTQFLGAFLGGAIGGTLFGRVGIEGVFVFCALLAALWFLAALGLKAPQPAK